MSTLSTASSPVLLVVVLVLVGASCSGAPADGDAQDPATSEAAAATEASAAPATPAEDATPESSAAGASVSGGRDATRETLVVVKPLAVGPIRDEVVVSAKVEARVEVAVFPKLSNLPILTVHAEEGDLVDAGQLLMTLYDTELRLAEQTAKARLEQAAKEVERARHKLVEADQRIARSERQSAKTAEDLERRVGLAGDGLVNVQEVEDLRLAAATAADDLELERFAHQDLALALELAQIGAAQAGIDWERARSDLSHCRVLAPLAGVVALRDVEVGELTSMGAPAFRLVDLGQPVLNLRVPQDALRRLAVGQQVDVTAVTDADARFSGRVRTVNPVLDTATGTVRVIVDLVPAPGLVPGLFCEARIVTAARAEALLVDKRAVLYDDDQPVFFALADGGLTVSRVAFRAGSSTASAIEVVAASDGSPVRGDLQVVVVGQENLKDGASVKVRETAY